MTKNIIIIILTALALSGILYGVCTSSDVEYAQKIQQIDEKIMELQYLIDKASDKYNECIGVPEQAHKIADEYRAEIESLNKEKAKLVGLEME